MQIDITSADVRGRSFLIEAYSLVEITHSAAEVAFCQKNVASTDIGLREVRIKTYSFLIILAPTFLIIFSLIVVIASEEVGNSVSRI